MSEVTAAREREVGRVLEHAGEWARRRADIRAVALVGSWARGAARMDSDVDLIVLVEDPARYVESDDWIHELGSTSAVRTRRWGAATERRLALPSGLELDVAFAAPSWASGDPGTAQVVAGGLEPLHDPDRLLERLA